MSNLQEVAPGVACLPIIFVNAYLVGDSRAWVLVDTGLPGRFGTVRAAAAERFGADSKPAAIVLTHGHFDHAGNALDAADFWNAPIYAHPLEMPYLSGKSDYPPPDPTVGGCLAMMSRAMPSKGMDFGGRIQPLPTDGSVPHLADWKWRHTPGHSSGHIALWRESDATLLAGDAVATADFDSYVGTLTKKKKLARGGTPFNCDWDATRRSVEELAALAPRVVACGHGIPMSGPDVALQLNSFAADFSPPPHGRYVAQAARTDENGVVSLPPPAPDPLPRKAAIATAAVLALGAIARRKRSRRNKCD